jgi:hypothetical protein
LAIWPTRVKGKNMETIVIAILGVAGVLMSVIAYRAGKRQAQIESYKNAQEAIKALSDFWEVSYTGLYEYALGMAHELDKARAEKNQDFTSRN